MFLLYMNYLMSAKMKELKGLIEKGETVSGAAGGCVGTWCCAGVLGFLDPVIEERPTSSCLEIGEQAGEGEGAVVGHTSEEGREQAEVQEEQEQAPTLQEIQEPGRT